LYEENHDNKLKTIINRRASVIEKLKDLALFVTHAFPMQKIYLNQKVFKDLCAFYQSIKQTDAAGADVAGAKWETNNNQQQKNIRTAIKEYYNNPDVSGHTRRQRDYALFCDNISFVLDYYYRNRFEYAKDAVLNPMLSPEGDSNGNY
jgi:hypothetical protein